MTIYCSLNVFVSKAGLGSIRTQIQRIIPNYAIGFCVTTSNQATWASRKSSFRRVVCPVIPGNTFSNFFQLLFRNSGHELKFTGDQALELNNLVTIVILDCDNNYWAKVLLSLASLAFSKHCSCWLRSIILKLELFRLISDLSTREGVRENKNCVV